jgi:hypothetical protein
MKLPPGGGSRHPQAAGITLVAMMPLVYECVVQGLKPRVVGLCSAAVETAAYNDDVN